MKHKLSQDNRGVAHLALIAVVVVVVAAVGFAAYRVMNKDKDSTGVDNSTQKVAEAECKKDIDDKDVCKFLSSWDISKQYRMVTTDPDGKKSTFEIDGDKSRISMNTEAGAYEIITIDKTTYTKAGDVWYKQTAKDTEQDAVKDYKPDFEDPTEDTTKSKTVYKKIGKEACGSLTCFKYQVVDPDADASNKEFIWFDDDDYKIRRSRSETKDGATEVTYEYDNVSVKEPSPVKELGPNQYIVPGQSEPMSLPTAP